MKGQWYPGHMARAHRVIKDLLKHVDVVIEVIDARVPASSRNRDIDALVGAKHRIIAMNKADLAAVAETDRWSAFFAAQGHQVAVLSATEGRGIRQLTAAVQASANPRAGGRARRAMIMGIPNVGKSSLINRLAGQAKARTGGLPGVTRGQQWVRVGSAFELLDLPGTLSPRLTDPDVAFRLAVTGALEAGAFDEVEATLGLLEHIQSQRPEALPERYGVAPGSPQEVLNGIAAARGLLRAGGLPDPARAAQVVLSEFRSGRLGRFTLDPVPTT
ncbi:MAG: ribosome biogenesis GTPase YlqF [Bacillota bacterium]